MFTVKALKRITCRYGNKNVGERFLADRDWAFQHQQLGVIEILEGDDLSKPLETKHPSSDDSGSLSQPANPSTPTRSSSAAASTSSQSPMPIGSPPTLAPATPAINDGGTSTSAHFGSQDSAASSGHRTQLPPGPITSDTLSAAGRRASAPKSGSGRAAK